MHCSLTCTARGGGGGRVLKGVQRWRCRQQGSGALAQSQGAEQAL